MFAAGSEAQPEKSEGTELQIAHRTCTTLTEALGTFTSESVIVYSFPVMVFLSEDACQPLSSPRSVRQREATWQLLASYLTARFDTYGMRGALLIPLHAVSISCNGA